MAEIHGTVAPGFEPVRARFAHDMANLKEKEAQLCVYVDGQRVIDLWAAPGGDQNYGPDSIANMFSSGKSLEAIALASLVARGLVAYDARIVEYWPEFGREGKDRITVADLMRHEAGLAGLSVSLRADDLLAPNIRQNRVGSVIEAQAPRFRADGNPREYHAITRGWIVNELFRRVDPAGRTIGEYLREEISGPLGADVMIGVREAELARIAKVSLVPFGRHVLETFRPRALGRGVVHNAFSLARNLAPLMSGFRQSTTRGNPPPIEGMASIEVFNDPAIAMGETPSANAHGSARGLALIAAMMASRGRWQGREYLPEQAWSTLHAHPLERRMGFRTTFAQGGVATATPPRGDDRAVDRSFHAGREGYFGWMGFGGSIFQWHPELGIGFGYVPTSLHALDFVNERGKAYQSEVVRCVRLSR